MILLVEDNAAIRENISAYLQLAGYQLFEFDQAAGVIEALAFQTPQLVILDVMLPDGNGFSLAKQIRAQYPQVPFLFLSARESESDRITGLELGAEDYIVKPFSPRELVLRVNAIVRRTQGGAPGPGCVDFSGGKWSYGHNYLELDAEQHECRLNQEIVHLTAAEWQILSYLARHPGQVINRQRLLGECLDYLHDGSQRTVNTHIKNLRAKLATIPFIETIRGFGYKFQGKL